MANRKVRAHPHGVSVVKPTTKPPDPATSSAKPPPELSHIVTRFKCDISRRKPATLKHYCQVCGNNFTSSRNDSRYCSARCRKIISRFHKNEHNIGATQLFAELYPMSDVAAAWRKKVANA